jgi:hypothetical protein
MFSMYVGNPFAQVGISAFFSDKYDTHIGKFPKATSYRRREFEQHPVHDDSGSSTGPMASLNACFFNAPEKIDRASLFCPFRLSHHIRRYLAGICPASRKPYRTMLIDSQRLPETAQGLPRFAALQRVGGYDDFARLRYCPYQYSHSVITDNHNYRGSDRTM